MTNPKVVSINLLNCNFRLNEKIIQSLIFYAVQKGKSKTPAQDRLTKVVKIDRTAVNELLKNHTIDSKSTVKSVLPKNYVLNGAVNSLKSNIVVANDVKPAQASIGIVAQAKPAESNKIKWSNDFVRNGNFIEIVPTTFDAKKSALYPSSLYYFHHHSLPGNGLQTCQSNLQSHIIKKGHDFQVQNRLKINDNSKIIGGKWLSFDLI